MLLLRNQQVLRGFSQLMFVRKNDVGLRPEVVDILNRSNIPEAIYAENLQVLRDTQSSKKVISFHNQIKNKFELQHLGVILMDTFNHAPNVVVDREYFQLVMNYVERLQTPDELMGGLRVLANMKRFHYLDKLSLSREVSAYTNKTFDRVYKMIDTMKDNLPLMCDFVMVSISKHRHPKKVIAYIEEYIRTSENRDFIREKYFIGFLRAFAHYPPNIINKFKFIEGLVIQSSTTLVINKTVNNEKKLEIMAAIATLGYQMRGHFFKIPHCFSILKNIDVEMLKFEGLSYFFEIMTHLPQSYAKLKEDAINQFVRISHGAPLGRMVELISNIDIEKLESSHLQSVYPTLKEGIITRGTSFQDLARLCKYLTNVRALVPEDVSSLILLQAMTKFNQTENHKLKTIAQIAMFLNKHSNLDLQSLLDLVGNNLKHIKNQQSEEYSVTLMHVIFVIQRQLNNSPISEKDHEVCQIMLNHVIRYTKHCSPVFLLSIDSQFLYIPYHCISDIQEVLLKRLLDIWPSVDVYTKSQLVIHYSCLPLELREQLYERFDEERQKNNHLNEVVCDTYVNLPDYNLPNLKKTFLASQHVLNVMMGQEELPNNRILRFLFAVPRKSMVMKNGILSRSYLNLIDRIQMEECKSININWLSESIFKLSQFVEVHESKLTKLYCNYMFGGSWGHYERYKLFERYFTFVGKHRDSPEYLHITEKVIAQLEETLHHYMQKGMVPEISQILSICLAINLLPETQILDQCRDLIRQNYEPARVTNFTKWQLLMLHLNHTLTFDEYFFESLYWEMQDVIKNGKLNLLTIVKYVELFEVNDMKAFSAEVTTLYSNFVGQILHKQHSVNIVVLLKLYKVAHVFKIEDYKNDLLDIISSRRLDENGILNIIETIEQTNEKNPALISKIISTCEERVMTLYPKTKVRVMSFFLRLEYQLEPAVEQFLRKLLQDTEESLNSLEVISQHEVLQKIGYKLDFLWCMLMLGRTQGRLFEILSKIFFDEALVNAKDLSSNSDKWKILDNYFLLDILDKVPHNYKSKFISLKSFWMIEFKANIPKDIKALLSKEAGWKLYPEVSGYKIMAYNESKNMALLNMTHRMFRPLTNLETGSSRSRDMIVGHYFQNPRLVKVDFKNYDFEAVRKHLE